MARAPSPAREGACAPQFIREVVFILFGAERDDRVDATRASRRNPGGQDGHDGKDEADGEIGLRIKRTHAEKKAPDHTGGSCDGERARNICNDQTFQESAPLRMSKTLARHPP